ncbi:hypothetical protein GUITHDRAFT_139820 [Guillardia theta CCMP2712]|uniref:Uncharacterized protein n=1 Tax=Guillardia theta (strain CCMP2712) TaxID=905079 RepID=L1J6W8_GUITC|nr:hypothetical protein GUITHDRAFT_139820 [Guillardia theta CCMP2712]EKX44268.1 hypothetical protein GUITHDRAFT_139820 [Guillardia theta CCMP2712]|eukprot:XP_005831248.1 hypothetical protein GUITHDRAFT_139820 [Guillardia theta CCMP2712]
MVSRSVRDRSSDKGGSMTDNRKRKSVFRQAKEDREENESDHSDEEVIISHAGRSLVQPSRNHGRLMQVIESQGMKLNTGEAGNPSMSSKTAHKHLSEKESKKRTIEEEVSEEEPVEASVAKKSKKEQVEKKSARSPHASHHRKSERASKVHDDQPAASKKSSKSERPSKAEAGKDLPAHDGEAKLPEYKSNFSKLVLHEEIPADLPVPFDLARRGLVGDVEDAQEPRRLQKLLELIVEAETASVRRVYGHEAPQLVEAFEEICAQFIMETERVTINKMKRLSNHRLPAQTAYARGEVERPKPNPLNDQRTAEEAELKALLAKFQEEERKWESVYEASTKVKDTDEKFAKLPKSGTMLPSSHPLMQELSIMDRNLLLSQNGCSEFPDLIEWARNFINTGMDRMRSAVASAEEKSEKLQSLQESMVKSMRQTILRPYMKMSNPKDLVKAVTI